MRFAQAVVAAAALGVAACGGVKHQVVKKPDGTGSYKTVSVAAAQVTSKEQNDDARAFNAGFKALAEEKVRDALKRSNRLASGNGPGVVTTRIEIVYGSQALRYWVGFGAGSGSVTITLALKDAATGAVRYQTTSKADLSAGMFGGDMKKVVSQTIDAAVKQFVARL